MGHPTAIRLGPFLAGLRQPIHEADTHVCLMEASRAEPCKAKLGPKVLCSVDSTAPTYLYVRSKYKCQNFTFPSFLFLLIAFTLFFLYPTHV